MFRSLVVLDGRSGTVLVGVDARFRYGDEGQLIDISGGTEAYFNWHDPGAWHFNIGEQEPREKRIHAEIFQLFEANAYFMLDKNRLATGAWIGFSQGWDFGPLSLILEAWMEGNALLSRKPLHFYGDLWLHGNVQLKVFRFGLGLMVDARVAAEVFNPKHIYAAFDAAIDLPWPLDDYKATAVLEWPSEKEETKLLVPLPLKEIAVEHLKVTTSWPLSRNGDRPLLLPNYDSDNDGFWHPPDPIDPIKEPEAAVVPVVPLDARPHLTFGANMNDDAKIGGNPQPVTPEWVRIGDPEKGGPVEVRFGLQEIVLAKWVAKTNEWQPVASAPNTDENKKLYGSWAPVPEMGSNNGIAQTKLWLWSKTPFDYTRHSSRAWDEWFTAHFSTYPCIPPPEDQPVLWNFEEIAPTQRLRSPWQCPNYPELSLTWSDPYVQAVTVMAQSVRGLTHALRFPNEVTLDLIDPVDKVEIIATKDPLANSDSVTFRDRPAGDGPNPRSERGVQFTVRNADNTLAPRTSVAMRVFSGSTLAGLSWAFELEILLPRACRFVRLTLSHIENPVILEAFNQDGSMAGAGELQDPNRIEEITFTGSALRRIVVSGNSQPTFLHDIYFAWEIPATIRAIGFDAQNRAYGPFPLQNDMITVAGKEMTRVRLQGDVPLLLFQIGTTVRPDPAELSRREEMAQHLIDSLVYWYGKDNVLEPHTMYRLQVVTTVQVKGMDKPGKADEEWPPPITEFAYFRTEGPPGLSNLSIPAGVANANDITLLNEQGKPIHIDGTPSDRPVLKSDLGTLAPYVCQTVPPTVPAPGEKPLLPRPVYRAYDVGVEFNENYVDLMYRLDRRDLGMYLYDNNNRPVRDAQGRLIMLSNRWGETEKPLEESDKLLITLLNAHGCGSIDKKELPQDTTLSSAQVLDPDTVYEARLVPLLLHESFSYPEGTNVKGPNGTLDGWRVEDLNTVGEHSSWTVRERLSDKGVRWRYISQRSGIAGTVLWWSGRPDLPASEQPIHWTDYRLSAYLRGTDAGTPLSDSFNPSAAGLVFRYQGAGAYYQFVIGDDLKSCGLVKVFNGTVTLLAKNAYVYHVQQDYLITIEVIGSLIRVYQDGALMFEVSDTSLTHGSIGLYCWANPNANQWACFSDVRVDDFRANAPVAYRFSFTTSKYANFFHQIHSFQDEIWPAELADVAGFAAQAQKAADPTLAPTDEETRAYERALAALAGQSPGLSLTSQNPLDLEVTRVTLGKQPVALLIRSPEPIDWQRTKLQVLQSQPSVPPPTVPGAVKLTDVTFAGTRPNEESVALLLRGPVDLSGYRIEYPSLPGPLAELSGDPVLLAKKFDSPNAVAGDPMWTDYRLTVPLSSTTGNPVGVIFRHVDDNNYYRLSLSNQPIYRRLIKKVNGIETTLWQDTRSFPLGELLSLVVDAMGGRLVGRMNGVQMFDLADSSLPAGRVGIYSAGAGASFGQVTVSRLSLESYALFRDHFASGQLDGWSIVDQGTASRPSQWKVISGEFCQQSFIHGADDNSALGSQAIAGSAVWTDVIVNVRLRGDGHPIGLVFRYSDENHYYRFSMDASKGYRRLTKNVGGTFTHLWSDEVEHAPNYIYELTVIASGSTLRGYIDGLPVFAVEDNDLAAGRIGLYCSANEDAHFSQVRVYPISCASLGSLFAEQFTELLPGRWSFVDEGDQDGPSEWKVVRGILWQNSKIHGDPLDGTTLAQPGTYVLAGDVAWTDYRLSVHMYQHGANAIGVMFRYQDKDNYYRLSMDSTHNYLRLIKKVGGQVSRLWEDKETLIPWHLYNRPGYIITVDCIGNQLIGHINGQRIFVIVDSSLTSGQIGLYSWANSGAGFSEVHVDPPLWKLYYRFDESRLLASGTRIRVYAGNPLESVDSERGLVRRYMASFDEGGRQKLPTGGIDLQLVAPNATVVHSRRFLPTSSYVPVQGGRVLRKEDGTGFFVLKPSTSAAGSKLDAGQHRLRLTYRRNNREVEPESPILSEAGNTDVEIAQIDVS